MKILPAALIVFVVMAASALVASPTFGQTPPGAVDPAEPPRADRATEESPARQEPQPGEESRPAPELRPAKQPLPAAEAAPRPVPDTAVSIDFEEEVLDDRIAVIERRLTESRSRVDSLLMTLELEVLRVQKDTLARRRELESVGAELSEQERLTAQDVRNKERLVDLVERYGAGDWVARHIKVELEKFRHRGQRSPARSMDDESLGLRLREYRQALFELGTLLFRVDSEARDYARALAAEGQPSREVSSRLNGLIKDRREALQVQERVLSELAERTTRLAGLKRQREDQLESLYTFVLGRMLWLRNREPLGLFPPNWAFFGQAVDGAVGLFGRVYGLFHLERQMSQSRFAASSWPWVAAALVFGLIPWLAMSAGGRLRGRLADHAARGRDVPAHRVGAAAGVPCRGMAGLHRPRDSGAAAVWPVPERFSGPGVGRSAATRRAGPLDWTVRRVGLPPGTGHGERRWGLTPEAGRMLRAAVLAVCVAAFVLLVPRYVVLNAPGADVAASLTLARLLMIAFALVVLVLAAVGCSRRSALMEAALRHSRSQEGFLWSVWPLVHLLVIAVLAGTIALNLMGYQYASQFIWNRIMGSGLLALARAAPLLLREERGSRGVEQGHHRRRPVGAGGWRGRQRARRPVAGVGGPPVVDSGCSRAA